MAAQPGDGTLHLQILGEGVVMILIVGSVAGGRALRHQALKRVTPERRSQLSGAFDRFQIWSYVALALLSVAYAVLAESFELAADSLFLTVLAGYVGGSAAVLSRTTRIEGVGRGPVGAFAASLALQYSGLAILVGVLVRA